MKCPLEEADPNFPMLGEVISKQIVIKIKENS